jgi:hypothetical protein
MKIKEYSIKDANGKILQFFASFKGAAMKEFEQLKKAGQPVHLFEYTIDTTTGEVFAFEIFYNWGE